MNSGRVRSSQVKPGHVQSGRIESASDPGTLTDHVEPRGPGVGGASVAPSGAGVGAGICPCHVIKLQTEVLGEPQMTGQPAMTLCGQPSGGGQVRSGQVRSQITT